LKLKASDFASNNCGFFQKKRFSIYRTNSYECFFNARNSRSPRPASSHLLSTSQQRAAVDTEKSFVLEKRDSNPEKYPYDFEFETCFFFYTHFPTEN